MKSQSIEEPATLACAEYQFFPATYQCMIDMLSDCMANNCNNDSYHSLVGLLEFERGFSYFLDCFLDVLSTMLGNEPQCAKLFIDAAKEINAALEPLSTQVMCVSFAALPHYFSQDKNKNITMAKSEVCKQCAQKSTCNGNCALETDKEVIVNHVADRLTTVAGVMESFGQRAEKRGEIPYMFSTGMYFEMRGVVDKVENGKMSFGELYLFNRMPNRPEFRGETIEQWYKSFYHDGCARNMSSDGYWEVIEHADELLDGFNEWGEDDLWTWFKKEIPDLKTGDIVSFRWNWHDLMNTITTTIVKHRKESGTELTEDEINELFDKTLRENFEVDEDGNLKNKIYNVQQLPCLII